MTKIAKQKITLLFVEQFIVVDSGDDVSLLLGGTLKFGEENYNIRFYGVDTIRIIN